MLGFGPLGSAPLGALHDDVIDQIVQSTSQVALSVSTLIIPDSHLLIADKKVAEGRLVSSTSVIWTEIAKKLASDWSFAQMLEPYQWEEMIAGAFKNYGYDDVVITPRSGDHGRD